MLGNENPYWRWEIKLNCSVPSTQNSSKNDVCIYGHLFIYISVQSMVYQFLLWKTELANGSDFMFPLYLRLLRKAWTYFSLHYTFSLDNLMKHLLTGLLWWLLKNWVVDKSLFHNYHTSVIAAESVIWQANNKNSMTVFVFVNM